MLDDLENLYITKFPEAGPVIDQVFILRDEKKSKIYKPLMERQKGSSLEQRLNTMVNKKRKICEVNDDKI